MLGTACGAKTNGSSVTGAGGEGAAGSSQPVTIRFAHGWSPSGDTAVGAKFVTDFAQSHKDSINLVEEVVAGDEMLTKNKGGYLQEIICRMPGCTGALWQTAEI